MPSAGIILSGNLVMPNGQVLWADEVFLSVAYDISRDAHHPHSQWADVDFAVEEVTARITAWDDQNNEIVLSLSERHPAILNLVAAQSSKIEQDCLDDFHLEAA